MDETQTQSGPATGESTATQSTDSTGQGPVETQGSQEQTENAGGPQGFSESGKAEATDTRRPQNFRSKNQTIYELRQKIREQGAYWETELGTVKAQLAEFQKRMGRGQEPKPSRTFWEAPEEAFQSQEERLMNHMAQMEERLAGKWSESQSKAQETAEWKQETSEAAKFIRSHKDLTEDDIEAITDLVREHPSMASMRPGDRAEYAMFLYGKSRGVRDTAPLKAKAAMPTGAPNAGGPRMWKESELEAEFRKIGDPTKTLSPEQKQKYAALETEIRKAYAENRVKK